MKWAQLRLASVDMIILDANSLDNISYQVKTHLEALVF